MRLLLGAVFIFSVWQASITLFAATMLRIHGDRADELSFSQISLAQKIDREHPDVLTWLGKFSPTPAERLQAARELTKAEPSLGSAWANLFELKLASRELDDELRLSLDRANELSPYDPVVQEQLLGAAIEGWLAITPDMRADLIDVAVKMLDSKATFRLNARRTQVRDSGLLPLVCQVTDNPICNNG